MAEKTTTTTEKTSKLFTVGPATQYIQHTKDKKNYWPGETFSLDHLPADTVERLLAQSDVVDVTGKTAEKIGEIVGKYPGITPAQVRAAMKRVAEGG